MTGGDEPRAWHRWGEPVAVVLNLAYTVGYQQGAAWSFYAAVIGSALFLVLCWQRQMKFEALLWCYYIVMAVYGAAVVQVAWPDPLPEASWSAHGLSLLLWAVIWGMLVWAFRGKTWKPGLDAFTTTGSIIATYWMLQFVEANWLYWIVVNMASVILYASRKLHWGTGLFVLYTLLSLEGWFNWI
jgi:nicotinamide mononucleotide transporter